MLLYSQPEPEWDDENRDWALALQAADDARCPVCGGPTSECLDPDIKWDAGDPVRCHRATAVAVKQRKYFDGIPEGSDVQARALIWGAKRRT